MYPDSKLDILSASECVIYGLYMNDGEQSPPGFIDRTITEPSQTIEFYLILSPAKSDLPQGMVLHLLIALLAMLAFGYVGDSKFTSPMVGFIFGMQSWGSVPDESFTGEAGKTAETGVSNIAGCHSSPCASVSLRQDGHRLVKISNCLRLTRPRMSGMLRQVSVQCVEDMPKALLA